MEQQIHFATTSDGVSIAYATLGDGPPLVYATGWPGNLAVEWEKPVSREFLEELAQGFTLVRYDMRGSGLSEENAADLSIEAFVEDLAAVVDHLKLETFALLSLGMLAGPVAITYAGAHPERVSKLVLNSAYLRGSGLTTPERARSLVDYIKNFGFPLFLPDANIEKWRDVQDLQRIGAPRAVQAAVAELMLAVDMTDAVERLTTPTLILHGREDSLVPFSCGRDLAAHVPHAEFVPFEGSSAAPWEQHNVIIREIRRFLGGQREAPAMSALASDTPLTILFTDMESSTALTQHLGDAQAQELVRAHNTIVREALASHGGSEIKHTGDGIMASFPSASSALGCAVAIQRGVKTRGEVGAHGRAPLLQVRIGLNAGEPVAEDADLFGTAVQLARRVCDHGEPGQILVSDVVRQLAAGKGFLFSDVGAVALKGFDEAVRLCEVRWRDDQ